MKNNLIYGLRDPRNDIFYYIGKTTIGEDRPITHLHYSHNENVRKWVSELKEINLEPFIDILEENVELNELNIKEKFWINEYKKINDNLLNIQSNNENKILCLSELDWSKLEDVKRILSDLPLLIKSIRVKYDLTQVELAKLCKVSKTTLANPERNSKREISLSLILKLINIKPEDINHNQNKHRNIRINRLNSRPSIIH